MVRAGEIPRNASAPPHEGEVEVPYSLLNRKEQHTSLNTSYSIKFGKNVGLNFAHLSSTKHSLELYDKRDKLR